MSIETEITRLQSAKANIKSAIETKWGSSIPSSVSISNYPAYVSSAAVVQYNLGSAAGAANAGGGGISDPSSVTYTVTGNYTVNGTYEYDSVHTGRNSSPVWSNGLYYLTFGYVSTFETDFSLVARA